MIGGEKTYRLRVLKWFIFDLASPQHVNEDRFFSRVKFLYGRCNFDSVNEFTWDI